MLLDEELQGIKSVAIAGHIRPDGDCIGSCLAVYNYIRSYYDDVEADVYLETLPMTFRFLKGAEEVKDANASDKTYDACIVLDCGSADRLGEAFRFFQTAKKTICIDHHVSNQAFAQKNYIVPDASSTCELVFHVLEQDKITKEIAECIYTGIVHDTGVFQYTCTSKKTMEIAGILMEKGIAYSDIIDKTFYEKRFIQNKILGQALLNSRLYEKEKCVGSVITLEEMEKFQVLPRHLNGIVNQLRFTKEADVAIFIYALSDNEYKVSTRCKSDAVDLSKLAVKYNGGGHKKAAGFSVCEEDPWKLMEQIVKDICEQ